jgi:hypothetical protein
MTDAKPTQTLNKTLESKKGYWVDDEPRGLLISVQGCDDEARISLSSDYWYRVQHFSLPQSSTDDAWKVIRSVMRECGRTLVLHAPIEEEDTKEKDEEEEHNDQDNDQEEDDTTSTPVHYSVPYLGPKQVDQIYYLIKHALTTAQMKYSISHSIRFDTSRGIAAPPKRRRRRKKKSRPQTPAWQTIGKKRLMDR